MRVLLLSAYDAASHVQWRETLCAGIPEWEWQVLSLPPRHFSWRIRSNPLTWWGEQKEVLEEDYDLLLATSMVDLATLRGLVPKLSQIPNLLYFHENQFAYPEGQSEHGLLEAQMVSLYSALAADQLAFNSSYNRYSFLDGCEAMLKQFPDGVPADVVSQLRDKSIVMPVPIAPGPDVTGSEQGSGQSPNSRLQLLWNHRWEFDKGPGELLALVRALLEDQLDFELHVVGQQFRQQPEEFETLHNLLDAAGSLGEWGYIESRSDYQALLNRCDVVVSTALHDFQGLSVLEACAAGCKPLVPRRLVYPEWFGLENCYRDIDHAVQSLKKDSLQTVDVGIFAPDFLLPRYRSMLRSL